MNDSIVCPDCSEGPDKCTCDNAVRLPSTKHIEVKVPKVKIKNSFSHKMLVEDVQESFPFMKLT